jgi:hypothetical protein
VAAPLPKARPAEPAIDVPPATTRVAGYARLESRVYAGAKSKSAASSSSRDYQRTLSEEIVWQPPAGRSDEDDADHGADDEGYMSGFEEVEVEVDDDAVYDDVHGDDAEQDVEEFPDDADAAPVSLEVVGGPAPWAGMPHKGKGKGKGKQRPKGARIVTDDDGGWV